MIATSKGDDKGIEAPQRTGLPSSNASEGGRRDDGGQRKTSHGFIQTVADPKDQVVERLNPSIRGSSIASMRVLTNENCKQPESQAVQPSESRVALEEIEGREEETSPHPLCNPSSSDSSMLQHNSSNRDKASPLQSDQFAIDAQTAAHNHHLPAGPPTMGFRPRPRHLMPGGFNRPAPPSYHQHHYDNHDTRFHHLPRMSGHPPPDRHYYDYSTPHRQRYPPSVYHSTPARSISGTKEGGKPESSNDEDSNQANNKEVRRVETLPLKKRKMIDLAGESGERNGTMKAISVDDNETEEKIYGDHGHDDCPITERHSWEEEHYSRYHTPRYSDPYPPRYHHRSHYYSPHHPPESDYYSPPRSHGRHHHYHQALHDYQQPPHSRQHKSVTPFGEVAGGNRVPNNETLAENAKQEFTPSRMDKLASAADTLEIRSETSSKAEEGEGEGGDEGISAIKGAEHKKCIPISTLMLAKFLTNKVTVSLPAFAEIVNFPEHLPEKVSPSRKSDGEKIPPKQPAEKPCVMCGVTCIFAGTAPSRLHAQMKQAIIPKQNKGLCNIFLQIICYIMTLLIPPLSLSHTGLCNSCDGKTWIFTELNAPIKWCKGCKNFRSLRNFGDKHRATKCVRCRQRQRENYAELKRKREAQIQGASLLMQQKTGWGSASEESERGESERGSPELDAAIALATLIS
eukprot:scaffold2938_cov122-Skeletonema_menzelii.AAC.4